MNGDLAKPGNFSRTVNLLVAQLRLVGLVVLEQSVEAPSHAIVIERSDLPLGEPEQVGDVPRRPLADAVERLAGQEQVLEQDQETGGRIDAASAVLRGQIRAEKLRESQAFEDAIEDREQSDAVGVEVVSGRFGAMADLGGGLSPSGVFTDVAPDKFAG